MAYPPKCNLNHALAASHHPVSAASQHLRVPNSRTDPQVTPTSHVSFVSVQMSLLQALYPTETHLLLLVETVFLHFAASCSQESATMSQLSWSVRKVCTLCAQQHGPCHIGDMTNMASRVQVLVPVRGIAHATRQTGVLCPSEFSLYTRIAIIPISGRPAGGSSVQCFEPKWCKT